MREVALGIIFVLLFVLLLVLFCAILIKIYIQKIKKYNQILFDKEINHQKKVNQTILETQESTLQNISQELHDDAGQQLTYINFQLEKLKLDNQNIENQINPISQSIFQLSKTIRSLSHSLNNQILSKQNVIKAIEIEANRIDVNLPVSITVKNKINQLEDFSTDEKIVIYRIFQEVINNALKHSEADAIEIILENKPLFTMTINDNGIGFDVKSFLKKNTTNGLQNLKSRAQLIRYYLEITS